MIRIALAEDIGTGDVTTLLTIPRETRASANMVFKQEGIVAGVELAKRVFHLIDESLTVTILVKDGIQVSQGTVVLEVSGRAQSILTAERVALNFAQRLSGIATLTAEYVTLARNSVRVVDTRKTTPGLRALEKWAVRVGGGQNHRAGLYDAVMIKDNHIQAAGSISEAVSRARSGIPHTMTITVECDTLKQLEEAIVSGAEIALLDNMTPTELREAVRINSGRLVLEASGGVNAHTIAEIARTGVDIISVGQLTHSAKSIDIGLDLLLISA